MVTKELYAFIQKQQKNGASEDDTVRLLRDNGWSKEDIADGLTAVAEGHLPDAQIGERVPLVPPEDLLRQTYIVIKKHIKPVLGVVVIFEVVLIILQMLAQTQPALSVLNQGGNLSVLSIIVSIFIILVSLGIQTVTALAILSIVEKETTIQEALATSLSKLTMGWTIVSLILFAVVGGIVLLVVPGVMIGVWLLFALFVMFDQHLNVFESFIQSRELTRGYWWALAWRIVILSILLGLINVGVDLVVSLLSQSVSYTDEFVLDMIISSVASVFTYPTSMIFILQLYKDIKEKNPVEDVGNTNFKWIVVALAGIGILSLFYSLSTI